MSIPAHATKLSLFAVKLLNKQELLQKTCKVIARPAGGDDRDVKRHRQTIAVTLNGGRKGKKKSWGGRKVQNLEWKLCNMKYADLLENSFPTERTIVKLGKLLVPLLLLLLLLLPLLLPMLCISAGVFPCH